jgi:hypothetical protein
MGLDPAILFHAALVAMVLVGLEIWRGNEKFVGLLEVGRWIEVGAFGSRSFPNCSASASLAVNCGGPFLCSRGTSPCSSDCTGSNEDDCAEVEYSMCGSGNASETMLKSLLGCENSLRCVCRRVLKSTRGAGCDVFRRVCTWLATCDSRAQEPGSVTGT